MGVVERDGGGEGGRTIGLATETMSLQKVTIDRVLRLLEAAGLEASVKVKTNGYRVTMSFFSRRRVAWVSRTK